MKWQKSYKTPLKDDKKGTRKRATAEEEMDIWAKRAPAPQRRGGAAQANATLTVGSEGLGSVTLSHPSGWHGIVGPCEAGSHSPVQPSSRKWNRIQGSGSSAAQTLSYRF
jgi:hypothetical protein